MPEDVQYLSHPSAPASGLNFDIQGGREGTCGSAPHGALVQVVAQFEDGLQQRHEVGVGVQLGAGLPQQPQLHLHLSSLLTRLTTWGQLLVYIPRWREDCFPDGWSVAGE